MAREKTKYQSVDYKFPKKLWMGAIWLKSEKYELVPYFLPLIKNNSKEIIVYAKKMIGEFRDTNDLSKVIDTILLAPLTFSDLFPLKKEYWEGSFMPNDEVKRMVSFCKAICRPSFHKVMITPTVYLNHPKETFLTAAFVFTGEEKKYLAEMVKASHHPVGTQYKNSAIYNFGEPFAYDLIKKKKLIGDKALEN